ncbi:MAG: membrane protease subunit HflC [Rhodobacteraceae bacterium HLUCCA08]|nr:MAG: membrane protease subunit HflC [Rhodobacteraceae bacterium HLUCCA08]
MRKSTFILPGLFVLAIAAYSSLFVVDERQKALVLQFGRVVQVKEDPGLGFKIPLIQEVVYYDDRIRSIDVQPVRVIPSDNRVLEVDSFARYRITDPVRFRERVGVGGEAAADARLAPILSSATLTVLGEVESDAILSADRAELMDRIRDAAIETAEGFGVTIVDVRLRRTDLPDANKIATFQRMISERRQEAADLRARGREASQRIRSAADRAVREIVSAAERQAQVIRGQADARAAAIYAAAYGTDEEFFSFYESLLRYRQALANGNTRILTSPDGEFFAYLQSVNGGIEGGLPAPSVDPDAVPSIDDLLAGLPEYDSAGDAMDAVLDEVAPIPEIGAPPGFEDDVLETDPATVVDDLMDGGTGMPEPEDPPAGDDDAATDQD